MRGPTDALPTGPTAAVTDIPLPLTRSLPVLDHNGTVPRIQRKIHGLTITSRGTFELSDACRSDRCCSADLGRWSLRSFLPARSRRPLRRRKQVLAGFWLHQRGRWGSITTAPRQYHQAAFRQYHPRIVIQSPIRSRRRMACICNATVAQKTPYVPRRKSTQGSITTTNPTKIAGSCSGSGSASGSRTSSSSPAGSGRRDSARGPRGIDSR